MIDLNLNDYEKSLLPGDRMAAISAYRLRTNQTLEDSITAVDAYQIESILQHVPEHLYTSIIQNEHPRTI